MQAVTFFVVAAFVRVPSFVRPLLTSMLLNSDAGHTYTSKALWRARALGLGLIKVMLPCLYTAAWLSNCTERSRIAYCLKPVVLL
jgi:hypothetical protein